MATAREVALDHYAERQALVDMTSQAVNGMWAEVDPDNIAASWSRLLPEATTVVGGAQLGAARQADPYTGDVLDEQGLDADSVAPVDPRGFAGQASDGGGLGSLLANPAIVTLLAIQDGLDVARALGMGRANLEMLARTQVADAGRLADQVSLTAHPAADGYVRVAVGGSCARCLLLSGRRYTWSAGFQRHPMCDCIHLPTKVANAADLVQHPRAIYNQMTAAQRARAGFTKADQRAIADGADLDQVVNAHRGMTVPGTRRRRPGGTTTEGTTRRGFAGHRLRAPTGGRAQRLTVDEIYRRAGGDRAEALRLLHRNGYLLQMPGTPIGGAVSIPAVSVVSPPASGAGLGAAGAAAVPPAVTVRPVLQSAATPGAVGKAFRAEFARITGRTQLRGGVVFRGDVLTAREHAEGLLRGLERFPDARLTGVRPVASGNYAHAETGPTEGVVAFGEVWTQRRDRYLNALANDAARGFHPAGTASPMSVALHEFGHLLDIGTLGEAIRPDLTALIFRRATERDAALDAARAAGDPTSIEDFVAGRGATGLIRREISEYALKDHRELVAEAFADVMANGPAASRLSREVVDLLEAEYRRGSRRAGVAATSPSQPAPRKSPARMQDEPQLRAAYEFTDPVTGYRTQVTGIHRPGDPNPDINEVSRHPTVPPGRVMVTMDVLDSSGRHVGESCRTVHPASQARINHNYLVLDRGQRGQGFATRLNAHAEAVYRANGIKMITLHANIDVGGYAWARAGYDFRSNQTRSATLTFAYVQSVTRAYPKAVTDRFRELMMDGTATPLDLAMVGHTPGATMWPGKEIMLDSDWQGVRTL